MIKNVNFKITTSMVTLLLDLTLISLNNRVVIAEPLQNFQGSNLQLINQKQTIVKNKDISNGYTDQGYTYIDPTLNSPERESSYHLTTNQGWSNDLQTIVYDIKSKKYNLYYLHTQNGAGDATGGQNWNRVTTKDFIHFSKSNVAIPEKGAIKDAWGECMDRFNCY